MKNKKIAYSTSIVALAASLLASGQAFAAADCPMLPHAEVTKAFNDPKARLDHADAAGMCGWSLKDGGTLTATVQKRPKASEAKAIYDSYKSTTFATLTRNASAPAVGQQAYFGMSEKNAERPEAGFISLQGDTLFILNYYPSKKLDDKVAEPLLALGRIGSSRKDSAAQSFGECEWFTAADTTILLGKTKPTVQRLSADHCIASIGGAALVGMTSQNGTKESLGNIMARSSKSCTIVPMPKLGPNAHASVACQAPADKALSINFVKGKTHAMIIYTPANRAAVAADVKALEGVAQRAFDRY